MERMRFGLGKRQDELKELLNRRSICVKSGNPVADIDLKLAEEFGDMFIDPKLAVKLAHLETKQTLTDDEKAERDAIYVSQSTFRKTSPVVDIVKAVSGIVENKTVRLVRIVKKIEQFNGKLEDKVMNYLPGDLRSFYNIKELNESNLPTSILRAAMEVRTLETTKEEVLVLSFVSAFCDKYTGNYEQHVWTLTYDLKDVPAMTVEEEVAFSNIENELA
ncbi:MAG: hypothetical protein ACRCX8_20275 [Sarcina sp.]